MKRIIILCLSVLGVQFLQAQTTILDSAKNEIYRINKVFDSSRYLSFDVNILYTGDSTESDQVSGTYILNRNNLYYHMGSSEYVQTDSFAYNIYPDEKMMVMTKNFVYENNTMFPLRTFVDSIMQYYSNSFVISIDSIAIDSVNTVKRISFVDTSAINAGNLNPYESFYIDYAQDSYYPLNFAFVTRQLFQPNIDSSPALQVLKKKISMSFSNYKIATNTDIFSDSRYTIYNRQRKIYETADKYRDYRFITSGFDNVDADAQYYKEVPYRGN